MFLNVVVKTQTPPKERPMGTKKGLSLGIEGGQPTGLSKVGEELIGVRLKWKERGGGGNSGAGGGAVTEPPASLRAGGGKCVHGQAER